MGSKEKSLIFMSWYSILGSSNCRLPPFTAVYRRSPLFSAASCRTDIHVTRIRIRLSRDLLSTNTVYICIESKPKPIERNFFVFRATATFLPSNINIVSKRTISITSKHNLFWNEFQFSMARNLQLRNI